VVAIQAVQRADESLTLSFKWRSAVRTIRLAVLVAGAVASIPTLAADNTQAALEMLHSAFQCAAPKRSLDISDMLAPGSKPAPAVDGGSKTTYQFLGNDAILKVREDEQEASHQTASNMHYEAGTTTVFTVPFQNISSVEKRQNSVELRCKGKSQCISYVRTRTENCTTRSSSSCGAHLPKKEVDKLNNATYFLCDAKTAENVQLAIRILTEQKNSQSESKPGLSPEPPARAPQKRVGGDNI
jgi:hypothetical protein